MCHMTQNVCLRIKPSAQDILLCMQHYSKVKKEPEICSISDTSVLNEACLVNENQKCHQQAFRKTRIV